MPKIPVFSIRLRIFALYAMILLATFTVFSSIVYFYLRGEMLQRVDALLETKEAGLEDAIKTYLKTQSIEAPSGWAAFFASFGQKKDRFPEIADLLTVSDLSPSPKLSQMFANIFDVDGRPIASSTPAPAANDIDRAVLRTALRGNKTIYTFRLRPAKGRSFRVRAIVSPVMENGEVRYLVQVRTSLKPIEAELDRFGRKLALAVFFTLVIGSGAGFLLVQVTLRPVDRMVRAIRNIRPENLGVRLTPPRTNDEIDRLAYTFNEMLNRLEKAFAAQHQIVQDISHELKTPLTILRGQLEVALKRPRDVAYHEALIRENLSEIARMRKIIDDLLILARLDVRGASLEMKNVHLYPLLFSIIQDARVIAEAKGLTVLFDGAQEEGLVIEGNNLHLERFFTNLLDNAVKYTPDGGRISVILKHAKDGAEVTVSDTGVGISPEHLPHIFDRFYRAKDSRGEGFGLGLSIAKSIVEAHRGRIRVESEPGRGTSFHIFFPARVTTSLFQRYGDDVMLSGDRRTPGAA